MSVCMHIGLCQVSVCVYSLGVTEYHSEAECGFLTVTRRVDVALATTTAPLT